MSELIFVTGATGFLGSHVLDQLLKQGYRMRATARGKKASSLQSLYAGNPSVEVVEIADLAVDRFPEAPEGVDAVIHVAAPFPSRASADEMYKSAIEGSLNVLRQAEKAGVKRFVVTSSTATVTPNPNGTYTDQDWIVITKEAAIKSDSLWDAYEAAKKHAELAIWEWVEAHPHVEVTTSNCSHLPILFARALPDESIPSQSPLPLRASRRELPRPPLDFSALSSYLMIYQFISPTGTYPPRPGYADFRDVARAHIGALHSPPTREVGRKRIIFSSPHAFVFKQAVELLVEKRPGVKERLPPGEAPEQGGFVRYGVDFERIEKTTGLKKGDFHMFEETFLHTIDSPLHIEEDWKRQGYVVAEIPQFL